MQLENKSIRHVQQSSEGGRNLKQRSNGMARRFFVLTCQLWFIMGFTGLALAQPGTITTAVGTGTAGYSGDGGPATAARINSPRDVFMDGAGNLYIADYFNHRVRKVDASGIITTVAGTGVAGFSGNGGPATAARLNSPATMAVDAAGNLYIADQFNHRIRKVDAGGIITTFAGTGVAGFLGDGGPATSARLNFPNQIEFDGAGNVYISDQVNDRIRKVDAGGIITTFAGTGVAGFSGDGGPATSARLNEPSDVLRDGAGNFYINDRLNRRIRKIDTGGIITTIAGTGVAGSAGDGGPATLAQLNEPVRVALDGVGNLYIGDRAANRIRMINSSGIITTVAGTGVAGYSGDGGPATLAQFNGSGGVAFDGSNNYYIVDQNNDCIRKVLADPPIANAGADQVICNGESTTLGATPAATGGTAPYSFNWTASPSDPSLTSPTDENPTVSPTVTTTYTLTVTDFNSFMDTGEVTVTVNPLPTATVSGDAAICAGGSATLTATLTGTGPWNITWSDVGTQDEITSSPATRVVNPASTTTYTVTAVSDANCTGTSSGSATVTVGSNDAPVITVAAPTSLWPPNHKYETITVYQCVVSVEDGCGSSIPVSNVIVTKVTSDEPEDANGGGDGNTVNDIVIASDCKSVQLRSERQGSGNGRVYTIHLSVDDGNGNVGTATCLVTVPKSQNGNPAIDDGPAYTVIGDCSSSLAKIADASSIESSNEVVLPESYALEQNYPNPFNPSTTIKFALPEAGSVTLKVYSETGQLVRALAEGEMNMGRHAINWDGRNQLGAPAASGIYLYRLVVQGSNGEVIFTKTKRMTLVK